MPTPNNRDEYKKNLLLSIYQLVQATLTDDDSIHPTWVAQSIHSDTREYFNAERWKPSPVYEGIQTRIPMGEVVTLHIRMWQAETPEDEERSQQWVTRKVVKIESLYQPTDGARFGLVPTGKRNPRSFQYRAVVSSSLKVWRGKLTPQQAPGPRTLLPPRNHSTRAVPPGGQRMNSNTDLTSRATHGTMKRAYPRRTGPLPSDRGKGAQRVYMKEQKTLNQWRKERGLEVGELAEKAGIGRHLINLLYSGVNPRLKAGLALAQALDVDVTQILWEKAEPEEVSPMPEGPEVTGNQSRVSREQYEVAKQWLKAGRKMTEITKAVGVSRGTLYKAFARFEKEDAPQKPSEGPAQEAAGSKVKTRKPKASKDES